MAVNSKATQEFVPIKEVRDGIAILKDGSMRGIVLSSSLNFSLKSEDERKAIVLQFQDFLNSLDFTVQISIQSRRLDIRPYMALLEDRYKEQMNDLMKIQTREYIDFIKRFGDIKSPAMIWLDKEGLLNEEKAQKPTILSKEKKDKLLDLLIESKGFGLEAVKAQLFMSIEKSDIDKLLTLRKVCFYSENDFTTGRVNTIGIFIRYLRKNKK